MAANANDTAERWTVREGAEPPLIGELVERIDEALATARASEAAVMTVGAAALDAAEQARRAAELAERASAAMNAAPSGNGSAPSGRPRRPIGDDCLRDFSARADRISARLSELACQPAPPRSPVA